VKLKLLIVAGIFWTGTAMADFDGPSTTGCVTINSAAMYEIPTLTLSDDYPALNQLPITQSNFSALIIAQPIATISPTASAITLPPSENLLIPDNITFSQSFFGGGVLNSNGITPNPELETLIANLESSSGTIGTLNVTPVDFNTAVPEPASWVLACFGVSALFFLRRAIG
jgi:hypothetical protein